MAARLGGIKQMKSSWSSAMNNTFLLFYSPKPRSQVWILVYRNWQFSRFDYNYQNSFRFCFLIQISVVISMRIKKQPFFAQDWRTQWSIMVVVVRWCHRAVVLIDGFHSDVIKLLSQNSEVLRIVIYTRLKINKK